MQKAEIILSLLSRKAQNDESFVFRRLYRNLFNPDFYLNAYHCIHGKPGNNTAGVDGKTIDGFKLDIVYTIIEKMKTEMYHPKPVLRKCIPKKNGKQRPLGILTFEDKLVQEVLRQILEAIYEPRFLDTSHGFRPNRSCQTALHAIKTSCRGTNWVIEGDIKNFFDNINHDKLIELLARRIDDGRFLELIKRFLKAGYLEWQVHYSMTGTPQGGIISPLLANIYLHELDKFMQDLSSKYTKGKIRKRNREYTRLNSQRHKALKSGNVEEAKRLLKRIRNIPSSDSMDPDYIRVKYTRYADDFVVCIIGSKQLAKTIREKIRSFLTNSLHLELNMEKTLITNLAEKRVRFLGYEIAKSMSQSQLTENTLGVKKRAALETIQLLVPSDVIREKIQPFSKNGKPVHHNARINLPLPDLINQYNAEIRRLYNYYSLATDVSSKLGKFRYYHYYSLVKTIARKEKSSVKKVLDKYGIDTKRKQGTGTRKLLGITIQMDNGEKKTLTYFNEPLKKKDRPNTAQPDGVNVVNPRTKSDPG